MMDVSIKNIRTEGYGLCTCPHCYERDLLAEYPLVVKVDGVFQSEDGKLNQSTLWHCWERGDDAPRIASEHGTTLEHVEQLMKFCGIIE